MIMVGRLRCLVRVVIIVDVVVGLLVLGVLVMVTFGCGGVVVAPRESSCASLCFKCKSVQTIEMNKSSDTANAPGSQTPPIRFQSGGPSARPTPSILQHLLIFPKPPLPGHSFHCQKNKTGLRRDLRPMPLLQLHQTLLPRSSMEQSCTQQWNPQDLAAYYRVCTGRQ